MNKSTLFITIFFVSFSLFSQKKPLKITYQINKDHSIDFYYKKTSPESSYIILTFNKLTNCRKNKIVKKTVKGWSGYLFKLRPINKKRSISFSYRVRYFKGNPNAKIDSSFVYVLPFRKDMKIFAKDLNYLGKRFGNSAPKNWKFLQFITHPNTAVFAIRKGVVTKIINSWESDNSGKEYGFKTNSNQIIIEHKDGSFAVYSVLQKNSFKVKVGDIVYPTTELAKTGSYDKPTNNQLRLSVYYLNPNYNYTSRKKETLSNRKHRYNYINPYFYTKSGITQLHSNNYYTSDYNQELIETEMTRREKRKWKKKHKK